MSNQIYDHQTIEEKWMKFWEEQGLFQDEVHHKTDKEKLYLLFAFAYPSGSGLHVGHVESKTALDILARYYRMHGKQVFFPVGWDAFGLPAENYAIKTGIHPAITTRNAIDTFRRQIKRIGVSYDWQNELATNHPEYYKWTQWIFLQLYNKGLAYRKGGMVNWCPSCQTVLANEQVVNGHCERCGSDVIQKEMEQWFFKITKYKDELISGLDEVDWPHATKQQQLNWIGKSRGLNIDFKLEGFDQPLTVWTKFWETVFGVTFVVIAPEKFEQLGIEKMVPKDHAQQVRQYIENAYKKTEEERKIGEKDKTGVKTGLMLKNPVNGEEVPLYIADYVLMNVGTGIVMGVPSHDDRDFAFAKKFDLERRQVIDYPDHPHENELIKNGELSSEWSGILVNSGEFNGIDTGIEVDKNEMAEKLVEKGFAKWNTTYKLRDWLISRQRYWGAPIPIVYDPDGKPHPVKEEHLPWLLPTDVEFKPTGESPLHYSKEFQERVEKLYGKGWRPEYDTMDTFVDSSWYFLRYLDSRNKDVFATKEQLEKWLPVDLYMIGPEHIVLHLLYARFFTKFLRDEGYLKINEPFKKMRHQGMIMGPDGKKMSKSKGNVINPDDVVEKYGADTLRVYEMFMGPIEADKPWNTSSVVGVYRFLQRVHSLVLDAKTETTPAVGAVSALQRKLHQTIRKVTQDISELKFNTAIAAMMEFLNVWEDSQKVGTNPLSIDELQAFIKILCPFAPFLGEELWSVVCQERSSIHTTSWPTFDPQAAKEDKVKIMVQVNGKVRGQLEVSQEVVDHQAEIESQAKESSAVHIWLQGKKIVKTVYIPGKILSIVVV